MDHLVIPLDRDHTQALTELVRATAMAAGLADTAEVPFPHVTLIAHGGLPPDAVRAVTDVVTGTTPFAIHAHGYGFFTGDDPSDLSLHVPVVRTAPLDDLHRRLCDALHGTGTQTGPVERARVVVTAHHHARPRSGPDESRHGRRLAGATPPPALVHPSRPDRADGRVVRTAATQCRALLHEAKER